MHHQTELMPTQEDRDNGIKRLIEQTTMAEQTAMAQQGAPLPTYGPQRWTKARLPRWEGGNPGDGRPGAGSAEWTKADMERNLRAPTWREHFMTHEDT